MSKLVKVFETFFHTLVSPRGHVMNSCRSRQSLLKFEKLAQQFDQTGDQFEIVDNHLYPTVAADNIQKCTAGNHHEDRTRHIAACVSSSVMVNIQKCTAGHHQEDRTRHIAACMNSLGFGMYNSIEHLSLTALKKMSNLTAT